MSAPSSTSSSWSKFFKHPHNHKNGQQSPKSPSLTPYPYSDNPFHRPPSAAGTTYSSAASEATFRTGHSTQSTASNNTIKPPNHLQSSKSSFHSGSHASTPPMSSHDLDPDEAECPVCLEPLSFSFRLPGEKPHVVPECGHALHEVRALSPFKSLEPIEGPSDAQSANISQTTTGLLFSSLWSSSKP
jgi:hypothetical protein